MWLRTCQITAAGSTWSFSDPVSDLRIRFTIKFWTDGSPNTCVVRITNPNRQKADAMAENPGNEGKPISIVAGYKDGTPGTLFEGTISEITYGRESPTDTILTIYGANGNQSHRYGNVNKLLPAGKTPQDVANTAFQAMQGVDPGLKSIWFDPALQMSQPPYPRSISMFGAGRHFLDQIAKSKHAHWFYSNGVVNVLRRDNSLPGGAVILNSQTGLIGMPTQTLAGIMIRCLINPAIQPGTEVQVNQSSITRSGPEYLQGGAFGTETTEGLAGYAPVDVTKDGIYKVLAIDVDADTLGQSWYQDLTAAKKDQIFAGSQGFSYATYPTGSLSQ